jgi:putative aldouronate transport system substrate-binding protein
MYLKQKADLVLSVLVLFLVSLPLFAAGQRQDAAGTPARKKISATVYDRGNVPAAEGTIENNRWTRWINEHGPVDVAFMAVPRVRPEDKLNTLFASGTAPDLIFEYAPGVKNTLYQQGMIMPVDEMIEKYSTVYKSFLNQSSGIKRAATMPDGKMYHFGKTNEMTPNKCVLIRADWLEKLGLPVPKTLDDYFNTAKAFVEQDPDGNGVKDTFGIVLSYYGGQTTDQWFQVMTNWVVSNNELVFGWDRHRARLDFKKKIYDAGLVDRDFLSDNNGAKAMQDFVNGKVGILPYQVGWLSFTRKEFATLKKNVPGAKVIPAPYPETTWGRFNPTMQNPLQLTAFVNAASKDPEAVMRYIDFISGDSAYLALTFGTEGVHYNLNAAGKPVILDTEKHNREVSWAGDFKMLIPFSVTQKYKSDTDNFDLSSPLEKEGYELYKAAIKLYLDTSVPYADLTSSEHMPQLPMELAALNANITLGDYFNKAIVSGSSYPVDQAIKDAQAAWEKGGGRQIEDWYRNWYRANKDTAFLARDIYEMVKQQDKYNKMP